MVTGKKRGREKLEDWDWRIHTSIYKIDNQHGPTVNTGNSIQNSVMTYMGKEPKKSGYVDMYNWFTLLYSRK